MKGRFLWNLVLLLAVANTGCTSMALERHALSQSQSAADFRYRAAMHALAMVAAEPQTLPSYALLSNGIAAVTDTGIENPATTWVGSAVKFGFHALAFTGSRAPQAQWTVDPVADYTQLEAMRYACRWALAGEPAIGPDGAHYLADPELDTSPGPHFGVADRMARLPEGWLRSGRGQSSGDTIRNSGGNSFFSSSIKPRRTSSGGPYHST